MTTLSSFPLLPIVIYPHPTLRKVAQPVEHINEDIIALANSMLATMYDAEGVGLAANQVNALHRVIVMDCSDERHSPIIAINPEIIAHSDAQVDDEEGCLSVPEVRDGPVPRYVSVTMRAQNLEGQFFTIEAEGLLARCIQHEIDHLNGKMYFDYLSLLKQERLIKKMHKFLKQKE